MPLDEKKLAKILGNARIPLAQKKGKVSRLLRDLGKNRRNSLKSRIINGGSMCGEPISWISLFLK